MIPVPLLGKPTRENVADEPLSVGSVITKRSFAGAKPLSFAGAKPLFDK